MSESFENIILTARGLFMRFGIKSVSMDDISRELGISKKTLYKYFASKKELVKKIVFHQHEEEDQMLKEIQKSNVDSIKEMLMITEHVQKLLKQFRPTIIYDLQKYHKEAWSIMESMHKECVYAAIKQNVIKGKEAGIYRSSLDAEIIARIYTTTTLSIVSNPDLSNHSESLAPLHLAYLDYHLHALMTDKGKKLHEKHLTHV